MQVTRCVCYQQTFAALQQRCQAESLITLAAISQATNCGRGCGSCRPYLQAMLDTGATRFTVAEPGKPPRPY